jgi:3-oxoadipate enol-lactonase
MPFTAANGIRIYYELAGDAGKPLVVFINGIFQDTTSWALATRAFASGFRTLIYDCRGQGQSDKPAAGPYTSELHARDLAALLDALGETRAHFVGLSNGGVVLQHFARLFPERLDKIVLLDTFAYMDRSQQAMLDAWRAALEAGGSALRFTVSMPWTWSRDFLEANAAAVLALREKAAQLPVHSSLHLIDGVYHHDARPWLPDIAAPTLIVHGDEDRMALPRSAREMQAMIPNSRLHWLYGAGHAAWLEQADEFHKVTIGFLKAQDEESGRD